MLRIQLQSNAAALRVRAFGLSSTKIRSLRQFSSKATNGTGTSSKASEGQEAGSKSGGGMFVFLTATMIAQLGLFGCSYKANHDEAFNKQLKDNVPEIIFEKIIQPAKITTKVFEGFISGASIEDQIEAVKEKKTKSAEPTAKSTPVATNTKPAPVAQQKAPAPTPVSTPPSPTVVQKPVKKEQEQKVVSESKEDKVNVSPSKQDMEKVLNNAKPLLQEEKPVVQSPEKSIQSTPQTAKKVVQKEQTKSTGSSSSMLSSMSSKDLKKKTGSAAVVADIMGDSKTRSIALRKQLENSVLKGLESDDLFTLKAKVNQLAADLFERITWENVRLENAVQNVEKELEKKYKGVLSKHKTELEHELRQKLLDKEEEVQKRVVAQSQAMIDKYEQQFNSAIKSQAEGFQTAMADELKTQAIKIRDELQGQLNHQVATLEKKHADHLLEIQPKIDSLSAQFNEINSTVDGSHKLIADTMTFHKISSEILGLEIVLSNTVSTEATKKSLKKLIDSSTNDTFASSVLDTLPKRLLKEGVCSQAELKTRFMVMREEMRKAALAPDAAPNAMIGQLIGSILATISWAPEGYITGPGLEETLARAAFHIERGNIKKTLEELNGVKTSVPYAQVLMGDWKQLASDRMVVDQAIKILKAKTLIMNKSYSG